MAPIDETEKKAGNKVVESARKSMKWTNTHCPPALRPAKTRLHKSLRYFCFYIYAKEGMVTAVPTYCMVPGHLSGFNSTHPMALQTASLYFYRLTIAL